MATARTDRKTKHARSSNVSVPRRKSGRSKAAIEPASGSDVLKPLAPEPRPEVPSPARLVSEVRSELGVTREFFARMTGFSVRAISGWESGRPLSEAAMRRVKEMKRLRAALAEGIRPEFIPQWLETPSEGLGGLKPVEVLERGEIDRLWRTVFLIGSGMPT
jgi:transcriptional regulator with XRE-family HTH domain